MIIYASHDCLAKAGRAGDNPQTVRDLDRKRLSTASLNINAMSAEMM